MSSSADTAPGTAPADPPPADPTPADPTPVGSTPVGSTPVGWDEFEPRPVPEGAEAADPVSPGREMAVLLQRYWSDLQDEGNRVRKETAAARQVLIELAVHVARLEQLARAAAGPLEAAGDRSLGRRLAVAGKQVREPLHTAGITTRDPVGEPYESVADVVDIAGWRYGPEFTAEVVAETVEPIVLDRGTVVRLGQVIMGAPSGAPADEAGDTEDTVAAADAAQDAGDDV
ncbi:hypothetical protein [Streptomyces griseiscabiei]|uniref:Nucleotide exchange factor GrpE n=1 Tax=Streptomyces griseiscabiei TaxID=2993540 RepID=A0ABU4KYX9_9ACTN|nr:hypothetical protein [Streptomyces griseiscabiei]MBZ3904798.1 hypothetical protein [Streptomyces griseiscabiei]MDX2908551.1 hypothetical protein [Streptomyces griseiscabiei]